ncbi:MAG: hypothetical protein V4724_34515 [Pseudomonadota bacterium]
MERPAQADTARQLLEVWQRLARQHVALGGAGCACGTGGVSLQLGDFEQDIIDFLLDHAERQGRADAIAFLQAHAVRTGDGLWDLPQLLVALGGEGGASLASPEVSELLLARLGKTLNSFAKLHG